MCRLVRLCQVLVCTAALCIAHAELTHWCAFLQHGYTLAIFAKAKPLRTPTMCMLLRMVHRSCTDPFNVLLAITMCTQAWGQLVQRQLAVVFLVGA